MTTNANTVKTPNQPAAPEAQGYLTTAAQAGQAQATTSQASGYTGAQGTASNYSADEREVGTNATVQGRMEGLLSEGSKYLDLARQNAATQANSRGFLNSTMAAGAGERAAIGAALPIASQDAGTYHQQSLTNQNAVNQSRQFNAGADQQMTLANMGSQNQANQFTAGQEQQNSQFNAANQTQNSQFNAGQEQQNSQFNAQAENQAGQFNAQQANAMNLATWSQQSQQVHDAFMAELNQQMELGMIDAKAFANLRGQYLDHMTQIRKETQISVNAIQTNENIPPEQKSAMIDQLVGNEEKGIKGMMQTDLEGMTALYKAMPLWQQNWAQV